MRNFLICAFIFFRIVSYGFPSRILFGINQQLENSNHSLIVENLKQEDKEDEFEKAWTGFNLKHRQELDSRVMEAKKTYFKKNYELVKQHQNEIHKHKFEIELNEYADMSLKEFILFKTGLSSEFFKNENTYVKNYQNINSSDKFILVYASLFDNLTYTPENFDWRDKGCVTPVKEQGSCGSCWAFMTVAPLECLFYQESGRLINLSEQQLLDCDTKINKGCEGGWPASSYEYLGNGQMTAASYKYTGKQETCKFNEENVALTVKTYLNLPEYSEMVLQRAIALIGPIAVTVCIHEKFTLYKSGVYTNSKCSDIDHGVVAVGYTSEYWIIKNSWSNRWGENGYMRIKRNSKLIRHAMYPVLGTVNLNIKASAVSLNKYYYNLVLVKFLTFLFLLKESQIIYF